VTSNSQDTQNRRDKSNGPPFAVPKSAAASNDWSRAFPAGKQSSIRTVHTTIAATSAFIKMVLLGENKKLLVVIKILALDQSRRRIPKRDSIFKMLKAFGAQAVLVLLGNIGNDGKSFAPAGRSACGHFAGEVIAAAVASHGQEILDQSPKSKKRLRPSQAL